MKTYDSHLSPGASGIAVFILAVALYLPLSYLDISMLDEGALLYVAERLTKGDVLYRDIVTGIMPGVYYLQALFFLLFGYSVIAGRVLAGLTLAATGMLMYSTALRFVTKKSAFVITMLFISMALPAYRWPGYSQVSITLALLSLLFFLRYLDSLSPCAIIISGASAGLALIFKQNYGVFITFGFGSILLARLVLKKEFKAIALFSLSFLVPVILTILYFYSKGALPDMAQYTFISLFKKAAGAYYKPYPLLSRADPYFFYHEIYNFIPFRDLAVWTLKDGIIGEGWFRAVAAIIYILPPLIIAASALHITASFIRNKSIPWEEAALVFISFLLFLGVFPRSDISHLTFIIPPILITGALLGTSLHLSGIRLHLLRGAAFTLAGIFSLLCLFSSYKPICYPAQGEQKAALGIPRAKGIKTNLKGAAVIRAITRHIQNETAPDEPILVVPTGAMYYFLTGRKSAVPYPLIMPGAMDEAEVISAMEKTKLRYVIYSDMSFDGKTLSRHMPLIHDYIVKNYHIDDTYPVKRVGGSTYVLKRGTVMEESIPLDSGAKEALRGSGGKMTVYYDFFKNFPQAKNGVILGNGRSVPPYRFNQVSRGAWLMKDAILQAPGRRWAKVYTSYALHIPADSALKFSIGGSPLLWHREDGDGVFFEVYLYDIKAKKSSKIFSRYLDPKNKISERRWFTYMAGLKKYKGRDLIISFVTSGGPRFNMTMGGINRWRQVDIAGWGGVELLSLDGNAKGALERTKKIKIPGARLPEAVLSNMSGFDDISFFLAEEAKNPGDYDVRMALGEIYDRRGRVDKAVGEFRAALRAYPAGSEARDYLARHYIRTGKIKKAEILLAEGLKKTPGDARLNMTMADLYRRRKEYDKAIAGYGLVLEARPTDPWARLSRGRSYLALGEARRAAAEARKVLHAHPGNGNALILLGDTERFKKEWKRAEKTYREALEKAPGSGTAAYKLGLTLKAEGQREKALRVFRGIASNKNNNVSLKTLAEKKIAEIMKDIKEQN